MRARVERLTQNQNMALKVVPKGAAETKCPTLVAFRTSSPEGVAYEGDFEKDEEIAVWLQKI